MSWCFPQQGVSQTYRDNAEHSVMQPESMMCFLNYASKSRYAKQLGNRYDLNIFMWVSDASCHSGKKHAFSLVRC